MRLLLVLTTELPRDSRHTRTRTITKRNSTKKPIDSFTDNNSNKSFDLYQLPVHPLPQDKTLFPIGAGDAVAAGTLELHGAWFNIGQGELHWRDAQTGEFSAFDS